MSELLDHMLHDAQLHPDVALVNGISVLLTLLEVRKGRCDFNICLFLLLIIGRKNCTVTYTHDIFVAFRITCVINQGFTVFIHSGEGEEPMTALDAERLAQGGKKSYKCSV